MAEAKRKQNAKKRKGGKTENSEILDSSDTEAKRLASTVYVIKPFLSLCFLVTLKLLLCKRLFDSAIGSLQGHKWNEALVGKWQIFKTPERFY